MISEKSGRLVLLALGFGSSMLAFRPTLMLTLPNMLSDLNLEAVAGGSIMSICQIAYAVAKPMMQAGSDGFDAIQLLLFSQLATALTFLLFPFANSLWQLQALGCILMFSQAPHPPAVNRLVATNFKIDERGFALSALGATANAVSCALPVLVTLALGHMGTWSAVFVLIGLVVALCALLQGFGLYRLMNSRDTKPKIEKASEKITFWNGVSKVVQRRTIWILASNFFFISLLRFGIEGWIGTFYSKLFSQCTNDEMTKKHTAAFLFAWQLGGVLGSTLAGPASDARAGYPAILSCFFAALLLFFTCAIGPAVDAQAMSLLRILAFLGGCSLYAIRVLNTLSNRLHFPPSHAGKADAVTNALGECGGAVAGLPLVRFVEHSWRSAYTSVLITGAVLLVTSSALLLAEEHSLRLGRSRHEANKTHRSIKSIEKKNSDDSHSSLLLLRGMNSSTANCGCNNLDHSPASSQYRKSVPSPLRLLKKTKST